MGLQMERGDVICNKRRLNEMVYVIQRKKKRASLILKSAEENPPNY